MRSGESKDANPARAGKVREAGIPGGVKAAGAAMDSSPAPGRGRDEAQAGMDSQAGRHVYRVGGFRIPVKNSVRGPKSRCAGRVKDLMRKRAEAPVSPYHDPTVIEPPIRKPPATRERHAPHDFFSSRSFSPGRGRSDPDADAEDLDDD